MSLENELNEILENTDKVYEAGQTSIAKTKMDKFGELIIDNSIPTDPEVKIKTGGAAFVLTNNNRPDHPNGVPSIGLMGGVSFLSGIQSEGDNQSKQGYMFMVSKNGAELTQIDGGNLKEENTLTFTLDNVNEQKLFIIEGGTEQLSIKTKQGQSELRLDPSDGYLLCNNSGIVVQSGAVGIVKDLGTDSEDFAPCVGVTDDNIEQSFVTVKYLKEYIKSLEDRVKALEGGTE